MIDAEVSLFFFQAIRLQFLEGRFGIINFKETSFLGRVASVFGQADLDVVSSENDGLVWRVLS